MALKYLTANYANTFQLMRAAPEAAISNDQLIKSLTKYQQNKLDYYSQLLSTLPDDKLDQSRFTLIKNHLLKDNMSLFFIIDKISNDIPKDGLSLSKFQDDLKKLSNLQPEIINGRKIVGPNFDRALKDLINKYDNILNRANDVVNAYRETNSGENNDEQVRQYAFNYYLEKSNDNKIEDDKIVGIIGKKWRDFIIPLGLFILSIISFIAIFQPVGILDFTSNAGNILGLSSSNFGWSVFGISLGASFGSVKIIRDRIKKREEANYAKRTAYINSDSVPDLVRKISGQRLGAIDPQRVFTNQGQGMTLYPKTLDNYLGSASNSKTMRNFAKEANKKIRDEIEDDKLGFYQKNRREVEERYQTAIAQKNNEILRNLKECQDKFYRNNFQTDPQGNFKKNRDGNYLTKTGHDPDYVTIKYFKDLILIHEDLHKKVKKLEMDKLNELEKIDKVAGDKQITIEYPKDYKEERIQIESKYSRVQDKIDEAKRSYKDFFESNFESPFTVSEIENQLQNKFFFDEYFEAPPAPAASFGVPAPAGTFGAPAPAGTFGAPAPAGPGVPGQGRGADALAQDGGAGALAQGRGAGAQDLARDGERPAQPQQNCQQAYPHIYIFYKKIEDLYTSDHHIDFANQYIDSIELSKQNKPDVSNLSKADGAFERNHPSLNAYASLYAIHFLEECRDNPNLQQSFNGLLRDDSQLCSSLYHALMETDSINLGRIPKAFPTSAQRDDNFAYLIAKDAYDKHQSDQVSRSRQTVVASMSQGGPRAAEITPRVDQPQPIAPSMLRIPPAQIGTQMWTETIARQVFDGLDEAGKVGQDDVGGRVGISPAIERPPAGGPLRRNVLSHESLPHPPGQSPESASPLVGFGGGERGQAGVPGQRRA